MEEESSLLTSFFPIRAGGKAFPQLNGGKMFQPDCIGFTYRVNGIGNLWLPVFNIQVISTCQQLALTRSLKLE